ncbi:LysR family transcriptional regulator [Fusibacter sp. 3D3]|uniref:LysR family transcriptional regulator n=1 Tax=Fusibacter sp. 3D3 TaxID=1048380 RepID=UPI000853CB9D|nr:LysR family transcriptional regulator [Fusibacter sp. 3D3]GAU77604.1 transcriptional regulator [Fusibacter sp. 3D3]
MNTDVYQTFVTLAKTLSFSKTAEQLNVVQSTVSSRIVELEKHLDQTLFNRSKRLVELTHAGRVFLPHAEKILKNEQMGIEKLKTIRIYEDKLKICNVGSIYRGKIAGIVNEFYNKYPMYEVDIEFKISEIQVDMLIESEIDIGFLNRKPLSRKIEVRPYMDYHMILVAPSDYPIGHKIEREQLSEIDLSVISHNPQLQEWFDEILPTNYRPRLRINSSIQLRDHIKRGYGCAFLQDFLVKEDIAEGRMKQIEIEGVKPLKLSSYIAINKSRANAEVVQRFLELIPEWDEFKYNI